MKRLFTLVPILFLAHSLCCESLQAQQVKRDVSGVVLIHPDDKNQEGELKYVLDYVEDAVVVLETPSDTVYTISDHYGRFLFRKVSSRYFKLKVECLGYETYERCFDADTLEGVADGISVYMKEKKQSLEAAVVKDEAPVFEFIGDTLKYNVAGTQKVADDEMLQDVLERLPGISVSNNLVKIMEEEISRIYINGKLIFGDQVSDPLRYLAGSEVVSLKVYDQVSREERLGHAPKGGKKDRVVNVVTKSKIESALIAQAIAGYGRNMENMGTKMDNRYSAGITGNWFSEMTLLSANVYLNNIGRNNEYSAVSRISSIPSSYSRVGYAGTKLVKKFHDSEIGTVLSASYSYGNTEQVSESSMNRVYLPDENWTSRTYFQDTRRLSRKDAHNVSVALNSALKYVPSVDITFSAANDITNTMSRLENIVDGVRDGYNQTLTDTGKEYKFSSKLLKSFNLTGDTYLNVDAMLSGGRSVGGTIQSDTSLVSSSVTSFVSEPQGKNLNADVRLTVSQSLFDRKWMLNCTLDYNHRDESLYKMRYADAVAEANLDTLTSDIHTYKFDTYSFVAALQSTKLKKMAVSLSLKAQYDHQRRDVVIPRQASGGKDWFSVVPGLSLTLMNGLSSRTVFGFYANPLLPSFEQIRSDFDAVNPLYISRGNPDLKKATNYSLQIGGSYMLGKGNSLTVSIKANYLGNKIVQQTRYLTENVIIDGYELPKGSTFSTYGNVDGSVSASGSLQWSARIRPLKLNVSAGLGYGYARDPSYIEEQLNIANRHNPVLKLGIVTNFSKKYRIDISSVTNSSIVYNTRYSDVSYLDQTLSLNSKNRLTDWMFINGQYTFTMRHPFKGADARLQDHMLNAVVGFMLKKSGVEINLSCYDILDRTTSFRTKVLNNYTQTTFNPDFGRIWMATVVWRFNSTQKGRSKVSFGFNSPELGRDYEDKRMFLHFR